MDLNAMFSNWLPIKVTLGTRTYNLSTAAIRVFLLVYGGWALRDWASEPVQDSVNTLTTYLGIPGGVAGMIWTFFAWMKTPTTVHEAVQATTPVAESSTNKIL